MTGQHLLRAGQRILVVEDDLLVSMMIEEMLHDLHCVVVATAGTLDRALDAIRVHRAEIDGVLLDLHLGGRLVTSLIEELDRQALPFIVVSGSAAGIKTSPSIPSVPWLMKPFTTDALARQMAETFGGVDGRL